MKVRFKKFAEVTPVYATDGSAGFDFVATTNVLVSPGQTVTIPTGLGFEIPKGFKLEVLPRSGVSSKTNLRVIQGTVDSDYRGEVMVIMQNTSSGIQKSTGLYLIDGSFEISDEWIPNATYLIRKGDRIAQGCIVPVPSIQFEESHELSMTDRGSGGFGSTGYIANETGLAELIKEVLN